MELDIKFCGQPNWINYNYFLVATASLFKILAFMLLFQDFFSIEIEVIKVFLGHPKPFLATS